MKTFIELAEDAAIKIEQDSEGNKENEFTAWLHMAMQREAMVTIAYQEDRVRAQLEMWADKFGISNEVVDVILLALGYVWAQEKGHQEFFESLLKIIDPPKNIMEKIETMLENVEGQIEGDVISNAMSPTIRGRLQAKIAIIVGKTMHKVPEYVEGLHNVSFSKYCSVNADLEQTAVSGYGRMIAIARQVPDAPFMKRTPVVFTLLNIRTEETYHERLFRKLAQWPPDPPPAGTGPNQSPFDPSAITPHTMTVAYADNLIMEARREAYGAGNEARGMQMMTFSVAELETDPFVLHMRRVFHRIANEGNFMTAGA
jgi:hypothetical protein